MANIRQKSSQVNSDRKETAMMNLYAGLTTNNHTKQQQQQNTRRIRTPTTDQQPNNRHQLNIGKKPSVGTAARSRVDPGKKNTGWSASDDRPRSSLASSRNLESNGASSSEEEEPLYLRLPIASFCHPGHSKMKRHHPTQSSQRRPPTPVDESSSTSGTSDLEVSHTDWDASDDRPWLSPVMLRSKWLTRRKKEDVK